MAEEKPFVYGPWAVLEFDITNRACRRDGVLSRADVICRCFGLRDASMAMLVAGMMRMCTNQPGRDYVAVSADELPAMVTVHDRKWMLPIDLANDMAYDANECDHMRLTMYDEVLVRQKRAVKRARDAGRPDAEALSDEYETLRKHVNTIALYMCDLVDNLPDRYLPSRVRTRSLAPLKDSCCSLPVQ